MTPSTQPSEVGKRLNASELDRYHAAERAYKEALEGGASEDEAKAAAVKAVEEKREQQFLRRFGLEGS